MASSKTKEKYEQVTNGSWMHLPRNGLLLACCDCHLVHDLEVKVDSRNRIWLKITRHERSTAALRRGAKRVTAGSGQP